MKRSKGFTLIELMVVIVILGILAAVIAPRIPQFVNKAKEGRVKGNLATLRSTLNIYYSDNDGWYPTATLGDCLTPKYIKGIPELEIPGQNHGRSSAVGAAAVGDGATWDYNYTQTDNAWGEMFVDCTHTDTYANPNIIWSAI